jgi:hypothetical protein
MKYVLIKNLFYQKYVAIVTQIVLVGTNEYFRTLLHLLLEAVAVYN